MEPDDLSDEELELLHGPPEDKRCVVLVGNPSDGWKVWGPLDDFDAAAAWCNEHVGQQTTTWIMRLNNPDLPYCKSVVDE